MTCSPTILQFIKETERPPRPGAVDNSSLLQIGSREGLVDDSCVTFKSPCTWEYIKKLYPGSEPDIACPVLPSGQVEMSKQTLSVLRHADLKSDGRSDDVRTIAVSASVGPHALELSNALLSQFPHCILKVHISMHSNLQRKTMTTEVSLSNLLVSILVTSCYVSGH